MQGEVSGLQMDLLELEVCRSKEGEKVSGRGGVEREVWCLLA